MAFPSLLLHCWLDDRKDIWLIGDTCHLPPSSPVEQMEEEKWAGTGYSVYTWKAAIKMVVDGVA